MVGFLYVLEKRRTFQDSFYVFFNFWNRLSSRTNSGLYTELVLIKIQWIILEPASTLWSKPVQAPNFRQTFLLASVLSVFIMFLLVLFFYSCHFQHDSRFQWGPWCGLLLAIEADWYYLSWIGKTIKPVFPLENVTTLSCWALRFASAQWSNRHFLHEDMEAIVHTICHGGGWPFHSVSRH